MGWSWISRWLQRRRRIATAAAARPGVSANDNPALAEDWTGEDLIRLEKGEPVDEATLLRIARGLGQIEPDPKP